MPKIRLTGLLLFTTAIMIGMAAFATQTSHLRFYRPNDGTTAQPGAGVEQEPPATTSTNTEFVSIPMVYPLTGVGILGLVLWFAPSTFSGGNDRARGRRRGTSRRRRSSSKSRKSTFGFGLLSGRQRR